MINLIPKRELITFGQRFVPEAKRAKVGAKVFFAKSPNPQPLAHSESRRLDDSPVAIETTRRSQFRARGGAAIAASGG